MVVRANTAMVLQPAPMYRRRYAKGMGSLESMLDDFDKIMQEISGGSTACKNAAGAVVPCPDVTSVSVCDKAAGTICFEALFPFFGKINEACKCAPIVEVTPPWNLVLTVGLGVVLATAIFSSRRGRR